MKNITAFAVMILLIVGCSSKETVKSRSAAPVKKEEKAISDNALQNGINAYKARDYEKAKGQFLKASEQKISKSDLIQAYKHLAFIYALQNNTDGAYKEFMKAFKLDKSFDLDKSELGHPSWTAAFERAKNESNLLYAKGSDLFDTGKDYYGKRDYANAVRYLEAAVTKDDLKNVKKVEAYKLLAFTYAIQKNTAQAKEAFKNAFKLDPNFQLDKSEYGNPFWTPLYDDAKKQVLKK